MLRYGAVCKDGWNSLYVSSLGAFVRIVRYVTHHRRYSPVELPKVSWFKVYPWGLSAHMF